MPYDRDSRYDRDGDYARPDRNDFDRPYRSGQDDEYSSAREYQAAGRLGGNRDQNRGRGSYGQSGSDRSGYGSSGSSSSSYGSSYGRPDHDRSDYGAHHGGGQRYGQRDQGYGQSQASSGYGRSSPSRYDSDRGYPSQQRGGQDRGRGSQSEHEERGFFDRAGDEVRSWFGDEEAERRRDMDQRYAERTGQTGRGLHDDDYHSWRSSQISSLDRDYDEYRRENRTKFEKEFSDWRSNRQTQRQSLSKVTEHQEVVGSDGEHVGTVDKVRGDRIILTKADKDAGGRHHSVPCSWITSVEDKVMLNKSAEQAKQAWRDEEQNSALSGRDEQADGGGNFKTDHNLNRSFSGTY